MLLAEQFAELDAERAQAVARAVSDLMADFTRQGGRLDLDQVERMIDKRDLSSAAGLAVYSALSENGISIAENDEEETGSEATRPANGRNSDGSIFAGALSHRLLTATEEVELGRRIEIARRLEAEVAAGTVAPSVETERVLHRGDEARMKFVLHNVRLVHGIARRYSGVSRFPVSDLLQEGMIGLMRSVELFDHTKGFKFSTYATWWIRQAVTRAITDKGSTIRLPVHLAEQLNRLRRAEQRLLRMNGAQPSVQDVADEMDWSIEKVVRMQSVSRIGVISLDSTKSDDDGAPTLVDIIPADAPSPEDVVVANDLGLYLRVVMNKLKPRERLILIKRFGFGDGNPRTLEEIGAEFGVTRERIRQIEAKALEYLRHPVRAGPLRVFVDSL